jgi:hypothetical protein
MEAISRACSRFMHRSIATPMPACSAVRQASSWRTPELHP